MPEGGCGTLAIAALLRDKVFQEFKSAVRPEEKATRIVSATLAASHTRSQTLIKSCQSRSPNAERNRYWAASHWREAELSKARPAGVRV